MLKRSAGQAAVVSRQSSVFSHRQGPAWTSRLDAQQNGARRRESDQRGTAQRSVRPELTARNSVSATASERAWASRRLSRRRLRPWLRPSARHERAWARWTLRAAQTARAIGTRSRGVAERSKYAARTHTSFERAPTVVTSRRRRRSFRSFLSAPPRGMFGSFARAGRWALGKGEGRSARGAAESRREVNTQQGRIPLSNVRPRLSRPEEEGALSGSFLSAPPRGMFGSLERALCWPLGVQADDCNLRLKTDDFRLMTKD